MAKSKVISSLQRLIAYLVITLALTIAALYIFDLFVFPQHVSFSKIVGEAYGIFVIITAALIAAVIIRHFRPFIDQRMGIQASNIVYYLSVILIFLLVAFGILKTTGTNTSDLLTGAGIISITAGLVISTFVGSILSGFLVFANFRFKVGDDVTVNSVPGKVIEMSALIMRIQTDIGQITIPNSAIASGGIIITAVTEKQPLKDGRLHYAVGDRVLTPFMNEQGTVKEITSFYTTISLDSGKEVTYLNSSVLSGGVVIAKITQPPT